MFMVLYLFLLTYYYKYVYNRHKNKLHIVVKLFIIHVSPKLHYINHCFQAF